MSTSTILYKNNLRTEATHTASGQVILTDAPIDNNGKGEAFSPTDLVATALASCMITIIAIAAEKNNIDVSKTPLKIEGKAEIISILINYFFFKFKKKIFNDLDVKI